MTTRSSCPMVGLLATLPWLRPKGPLVESSKDCSGYPVLSHHLQNNHIIITIIIISVKHSRQPILKIILTCSLNKHFIECLSHAFPYSSRICCNARDPSSIPGLGRSTAEGIGYHLQYSWVSLVAQLVKNLPAMQETWL